MGGCSNSCHVLSTILVVYRIQRSKRSPLANESQVVPAHFLPKIRHILRNIFFFISREWIIPWMMDGQHKRIVRNDHDVGSWWWYRSPGRRQLRTYYRFPGGRSPSSFLCCCSPEKKEEERAHSEKRKNIYQREWIVVIDAL